ncbi:bd5fd55f-2f62-4ed6-b468-1863d6db3cb9 [Sclerotinia trifoliorum]|uniref:Bd5fd55f-2f62-4ed6-b468-1863d6db3cb9 n=1 Tax=Sclerotinia trifoliorum TaxID=28548 RepID=A0A8H2W510_9HELO|nr:bd5fd55f-2f62-4ed6-b468-1863d6db3cb9 [Sclerotinia trifoliorum]
MQKVIRRTILAEKQAVRRLARRQRKNELDEFAIRQDRMKMWNGETLKRAKENKVARREDWELKELAPKRDVGSKADKYGSIESHSVEEPAARRKEILEILDIWGGKKYLNITAGDRVVVIQGRDKGKIGKVEKVDKQRAEVYCEGLNMVDLAIPEWMKSDEDPDRRPTRSFPQGISLKNVKLVFPYTDPITGLTRDVIAKKLVHHKMFRDRHGQTVKWQRIIPGAGDRPNIIIPWPKTEPREKKDHDCDTLRMEVEERTFVPTLLTPPMPASVIDELRNKYSVFRKRHDPEYVERKLEEDRQNETKNTTIASMRTPLKELNKRERALRKAKGKGKLTRGMLLKIGEVISRRRGTIMRQVGISTIEGATTTEAGEAGITSPPASTSTEPVPVAA